MFGRSQLDRLLEILYVENRPWLLQRAYFFGAQNRDEADAIVQDAMVRILGKRPDCATLNQLKAYTNLVIRSVAIDRARKRSRIVILEGDSLVGSRLPPPGASSDAKSSVDLLTLFEFEDRRRQDTTRRCVDAAIRELPPHWRHVMQLRYGLEDEPMAFSEIGRRVGQTEDAVKAYHKRSIKRLRRLLEKSG